MILVTGATANVGGELARYPKRQQFYMKGMSSAGITTKGRIMSRSSCSRMWQ